MRVVAGTARGRRIQAPPGRSTRPTSDRVREATFNALESLGALRGADVLDLFAGSGALGIEAVSRGASQATFVDVDSGALAVVRANLVATGLAGSASVVQADALTYLGVDRDRVGLVLLDPPYRYDDEAWQCLLGAVEAELAVLESDRTIEVGERWQVLRSKRYGATVVTLAGRR